MSIAPHSCLYLVLSIFCIACILVSLYQDLTEVLIRSSWVINDVEHFFTGLWLINVVFPSPLLEILCLALTML